MSERPFVNEVPEKALLWLDRDNANWIHLLADRDFGGDRNLALNATLRAVAAVDPFPENLWALTWARSMVKHGLDPLGPQERSEGP